MITSEKERALIALYAEMATMTNQECAKCNPPWSCCEYYGGYYCEEAIWWAETAWGVKLDRLSYSQTLPMMGLSGCTAEPHFRPICTMYTCHIRHGVVDVDDAWTAKYLRIKQQIYELEKELHSQHLPRMKEVY